MNIKLLTEQLKRLERQYENVPTTVRRKEILAKIVILEKKINDAID